MCRYATKRYKIHYACFECRVAFKECSDCPECEMPMVEMGRDFKAPPRNDRKWWRNAEILANAGFRFESCGCSGPKYGPLGKRLSGAQAFVDAHFRYLLPKELRKKHNANSLCTFT